MKVVIDTCSLLALVRYYLPLDTNSAVFNFFKAKIEAEEIIIIDKVYEECQNGANSLVFSKMNFLSDKVFQKAAKIPYNTSLLIAPSPALFLRMMENNFVIGVQKNKLSNEEFEIQKSKHMKGADIMQIILCLNLKKNTPEVVLVTEESSINNDNKLFKKIPLICEFLEIKTMTLPELIQQYKISINFSV